MKSIKWVLSTVVFSLSMPASATILTFEGMGLLDFGDVSQNYGDSVSTLSSSVGNYGFGNGYTSNISTSYQTLNTDGSLFENHVEYWSTGYGDLTGVVFASQNNKYANITLTADPGWNVTINRFDMVGWFQSDLALSGLVIMDSSLNILWDAAVSVIHGAGGTHDTFIPNITADSLVLQWGTSWNIGLDNFNFDQVSTVVTQVSVPEPITFALMVLGLIGFIGVRRRVNGI